MAFLKQEQVLQNNSVLADSEISASRRLPDLSWETLPQHWHGHRKAMPFHFEPPKLLKMWD